MIDEREFIPSNRAEALELEHALMLAGCSRAMAAGIVMSLIRLGERGEDGLFPGQRTVYRRELKKLGAPPWGGDGLNRDMGAYIGSVDVRRGRDGRGRARQNLWLRRPSFGLIGALARS